MKQQGTRRSARRYASDLHLRGADLTDGGGWHVAPIPGSPDPLAAAPDATSDGAPAPFHLTEALTALCADVCRRMPVFAHVRMDTVLLTFARSKVIRSWGLQARLVPMRFADGSREEVRRGHRYRIQQYHRDGRPLDYLFTVYLPRFLDNTFEEKMITVFHELYHIGPRCAGDIRQFPGANHVHSGSMKAYDRHMAKLVDEYLAFGPPPELYTYLTESTQALVREKGSVVGVTLPLPKLIPAHLVSDK